MRYVGIDIGKWKCQAAVMDPEGSIIEEFTFPNDAEGMEKLASRLTPEDRVVMESTGSVWSTLYNNLDERHIPVTLANPLKTRAIASARIKTDKVDARILAHLLRGDLVAECQRSAERHQRDPDPGQAPGSPRQDEVHREEQGPRPPR